MKKSLLKAEIQNCILAVSKKYPELILKYPIHHYVLIDLDSVKPGLKTVSNHILPHILEQEIVNIQKLYFEKKDLH